MSDSFSRRNLFRLGLKDLATAWGHASKEIGNRGTTSKAHRVRPPGAIAESNFLETCTRCHACAEACPFDIIQILGPLAGSSEGTPVLQLKQDPCHWCGTMDCIRACPSDALLMPEDEKVLPLGKAWLTESQCLNADGLYCDACVMFCPSDVQAITMGDPFPIISQDQCVGCGLCIFHCEATPKAITWYPVASSHESLSQAHHETHDDTASSAIPAGPHEGLNNEEQPSSEATSTAPPNNRGRPNEYPSGKDPRRILYRLLCVSVLAWLTFTQWLLPIKVTGYSMFPTYRDGQINYANRLAYLWSQPRRGDIVVIRTTGEQVTILKRIVGMPGERVRMDNGRLFINGKQLDEPYLRHEGGWRHQEILLGEGEYWAAGDNRPISEFGKVTQSRLAGKILF